MKNEPRNTRARCRPDATQQSARFRARRAPRLRRLRQWPEVQATLVSERKQPILSDDTTPTPHDQRNQLAAAAAQMALSKKTRGLYSPRTMQTSRRGPGTNARPLVELPFESGRAGPRHRQESPAQGHMQPLAQAYARNTRTQLSRKPRSSPRWLTEYSRSLGTTADARAQDSSRNAAPALLAARPRISRGASAGAAARPGSPRTQPPAASRSSTSCPAAASGARPCRTAAPSPPPRSG